MAYRVVLSKSAAKELSGLPSKTHDKVIEHLRGFLVSRSHVV